MVIHKPLIHCSKVVIPKMGSRGTIKTMKTLEDL